MLTGPDTVGRWLVGILLKGQPQMEEEPICVVKDLPPEEPDQCEGSDKDGKGDDNGPDNRRTFCSIFSLAAPPAPSTPSSPSPTAPTTNGLSCGSSCRCTAARHGTACVSLDCEPPG